jgi:CRISPR/Cas system-associated protein Cas5 (RAMP superfamily)
MTASQETISNLLKGLGLAITLTGALVGGILYFGGEDNKIKESQSCMNEKLQEHDVRIRTLERWVDKNSDVPGRLKTIEELLVRMDRRMGRIEDFLITNRISEEGSK